MWRVPSDKPLSYSLVTLSAITVAFLNTSISKHFIKIVMPLDVAKTFMQKYHP